MKVSLAVTHRVVFVDTLIILDITKPSSNDCLVWLQTELDYVKFCYRLIITLTKFVIMEGSILKSKHKKFQDLFGQQ